MRVFCLGGAGMICREAVLDLVQYSACSLITVADCDVPAGRELVESIDDPRVHFIRCTVRERETTIEQMRGYGRDGHNSQLPVN